MRSYILYGKGRLEFEVPDHARIVQQKEIKPLQNIEKEFELALSKPIASKSLTTLIKLKEPETACVVVSDITRPIPYKKILGFLLASIESAGVLRGGITVLVATGMHRPSTDAEKKEMFGEDIVRNYHVIDHDASDSSQLVQLGGRTSKGTVACANKYYMAADLKILTGLIEPHFMAGFSGGRKSICPGIVDLETISNFHGYEFLANPKADNGIVKGNPCHNEALEIVKKAGCDFIVNVVINREREITGLFCGHPFKAHEKGMEFVKKVTGISLGKEADLVITSGGGYPLDKTFYQAVKGMVSALPFVKKNGTMILGSECNEQIGSPEYKEMLLRYQDDWKLFLKDIQGTKAVIKDQWQIQMQCKALDKLGKGNIVLVSNGIPVTLQEKINVTPSESLTGDMKDISQRFQKTVDCFLQKNDPRTITVIPEGPYVYGVR